MDNEHPPRSETRSAIDRLDQLLHLSEDGRSLGQDWYLAAADPDRVHEFCMLYEIGVLDEDAKFALMQLMIASLDELLEETPSSPDVRSVAERVEGILNRDFLLHFYTIGYWRLHGEDDPEYQFKVTNIMRRVWDKNFMLEYKIWL